MNNVWSTTTNVHNWYGRSAVSIPRSAFLFQRKEFEFDCSQMTEIASPTLKLCIGIVGRCPAKICLKDKIAQKRKKEPQPIESGPQVDKDKKQKKDASTFKKKKLLYNVYKS